MDRDVDLASVARLIGEPARATMLEALMSGQALPAGHLGRVAGVSAATASEHLARLRAGGLIEAVASGRHRYYRLTGPDVAHALEALAMVARPGPVRSLRQSRAMAAMATARTCYDHLAGRVGVAVHDALVDRAALVAGGDGYLLTDAGGRLVDGLGVPLAAVRAGRRAFARPCVDVTERRPHLAGALGGALCSRMLELGWLVRRAPGERGLRVTATGWAGLADWIGVSESKGAAGQTFAPSSGS